MPTPTSDLLVLGLRLIPLVFLPHEIVLLPLTLFPVVVAALPSPGLLIPQASQSPVPLALSPVSLEEALVVVAPPVLRLFLVFLCLAF